MKRFSGYIAALAITVLCVPVFSQINLNYFSSRGVSSGKGACTKIDSVLVDMKVGAGVATTMLTLYLRESVTNSLIRHLLQASQFSISPVIRTLHS